MHNGCSVHKQNVALNSKLQTTAILDLQHKEEGIINSIDSSAMWYLSTAIQAAVQCVCRLKR